MSQIDVPLSTSGFGQTRRADNWWVQPLFVFLGSIRFHRLRHLGRAARRPLPFRPLYLAILFPRIVRTFRPRLVRCKTNVDTRLGHRRDADTVGSRRIPRHLLLLPRRVLQSVLGRSSLLRRRRTAQELLGERSFPLIIQNIHRYFLYLALIFLLSPRARRLASLLVRRPLRHWRRHAGPARECDPAELLHPGLPFVAPPDRRLPRSTGRRAGPQESLRLRELPKPRPHAFRLVQPVHGHVQRFVRALVLDGRVDRLEDFLVPDYITHDHDVLIIGAGGAGLRAAVAASAAGAKVAVISKSLLGKAHTVMAEGGIAAAHGQCGRPRQLARALCRHHARRPVSE